MMEDCSLDHLRESNPIKDARGVLPIVILLNSLWEKPRFRRTTGNIVE
jgi:hypothetical protein